MHPMTPGDMLDAIALVRAFIAKDEEAQRVICENGSPAAMLPAVISMMVGMVARTRQQEPDLDTYLGILADRWLGLVNP